MKIALALLALVAAVSIFATGCDDKSQASAPTATEVAATAEKTAEKPAAKPAEKPADTQDSEPAKKPADKPGKMRTTESGLKYQDKKVGDGEEVKVRDKVTVHYKGWLDDGTVFDTSRRGSGDPFVFRVGVGEVIQGWDEGIVGMKVGGIRELTIPAELGYGSNAMGPIPANSTLHFEVEVMATSH